jgi:hypothetical protein
MRQDQYTITPRAIHHHAAQLCQRHLRFHDHGPKCTALNLLTVLFYAAARIISRAAACASLRDAPSDSALHAALMATLPDSTELQRRLNRALQGDLPKSLRRRRQPLAIDLVLIPYHGEPLQDANEVYRSQAKQGTSHFHAYATAYVIRQGQRFTVALAYVRKGDDLADVVKGLLRQAARAGVRPRYLLLDRGFYAVRVVRYLQAARCPFLMPVPAKGRKADHPKGPSGTRVFHLCKRSGWSQHTLCNEAGQQATIQICVRCRNYRGQWQRHGRQASSYCTLRPKRSTKTLSRQRPLPSMLTATPADSSRPVHACAVNCPPWSVLNTAGRPVLRASSSMSRQKEPSSVLDSRQAST